MDEPSDRRWRSGGTATAWAAAALLCGAATAAPLTGPAVGRYDATLCVTSGAHAPSCGPADVDVRPGGSVSVQVSDIVYRLRVRTGQAAVVVTQGTMQIDEFDAGAEWSEGSLRFADADKNVRYDVQIGGIRRAPK